MSLRKRTAGAFGALALSTIGLTFAAAAPSHAATNPKCTQTDTWSTGGLSLDAQRFGDTPGTKVITYPFNGGTNEYWCMEPAAEGGWYFHPSYDTNMCMDVPSSNFSAGVYIQLWNCDGTLAQRWSVAGGSPIRPMGNQNLSLRSNGNDTQTSLVAGTAQNWS